MELNDLVDLFMSVVALALAFSCGYEKGRGDQMQNEIDFYEKLEAEKEKKTEEGD